MAFAILEEEGFKMISDDEPIIASSGEVLPFALRIGTLDSEKIDRIPPEFVYNINRMEFMLSHSPWSTISQVSTVFRRSMVAYKLLRSSKTYQFILSGNVDENGGYSVNLPAVRRAHPRTP